MTVGQAAKRLKIGQLGHGPTVACLYFSEQGGRAAEIAAPQLSRTANRVVAEFARIRRLSSNPNSGEFGHSSNHSAVLLSPSSRSNRRRAPYPASAAAA